MRRHHGIAAVAISGAIVAVHVWTQPFPPPELGVGPEMFDWRPGSFALIFGFLVAILILAVAIGFVVRVMRELEARRQRIRPPGHNRSARRSA